MHVPRGGRHAGNQWDPAADVVVNVVLGILDSLLIGPDRPGKYFRDFFTSFFKNI